MVKFPQLELSKTDSPVNNKTPMFRIGSSQKISKLPISIRFLISLVIREIKREFSYCYGSIYNPVLLLKYLVLSIIKVEDAQFLQPSNSTSAQDVHYKN